MQFKQKYQLLPSVLIYLSVFSVLFGLTRRLARGGGAKKSKSSNALRTTGTLTGPVSSAATVAFDEAKLKLDLVLVIGFDSSCSAVAGGKAGDRAGDTGDRAPVVLVGRLARVCLAGGAKSKLLSKMLVVAAWLVLL